MFKLLLILGLIISLIVYLKLTKKEGMSSDIYPVPDVKVPSFAEHIAPLFRPYDVLSMKWKFDLSKYEDVYIYAEPIYRVVKNKQMPCDKPWEDENIALFKRWMDTGMKP